MKLGELRLSAHNLQIETGRFSKKKTPRDERFCLYCKSQNTFTVENEVHFVLACPLYNEQRRLFLEEIYRYFPTTALLDDYNMYKWLMSQEDYNITKRLGMFCKNSFSKRAKYISK